MIDIIQKITKAICPFCRNSIQGNAIILTNVDASCDKDAVEQILADKVNRMVCPDCGMEFIYEHNCGIINPLKDYAVASLPAKIRPVPHTRAPLYKILGKDKFRFRYVGEFIFLTEKVRLFEHGLDDRIIELIKYNHIVLPKYLDVSAKIILTGTDGDALVFTIYDKDDFPVATHRVSKNAYHTYNKSIEEEILEGATAQWQEINLRGAENYTKENLK